MMKINRMMYVLGVAFICFLILPNLFHEPLHLVAVNLIGGQGAIEFSFPRPLVHATYELTQFNVWAFLFFPIAIQVLVMLLLMLSNSDWAVGVNTYFVSDLYFQWTNKAGPYSDLRFIGDGSLYSCVAMSIMATGVIMYLLYLYYTVKRFKYEVALDKTDHSSTGNNYHGFWVWFVHTLKPKYMRGA